MTLLCVNITRRFRRNRSSRCWHRARAHADPTSSGRIQCGGDSHPDTPSFVDSREFTH